MWSGQRLCWTVTNCLLSATGLVWCANLFFFDCVCGPPPSPLYTPVCMFEAVYPLCLCALTRAHAARVARQLGCPRRRQVRHVAGDRQVFGAASPLCNFGPLMCRSWYQRVSAVPSMQRHWSVQLQSAAPRPRSFPSRSRARQPG